MVVNRKQPVVPVPPISRTTSSQPSPTKRQSRISKAVNSVPSSIAPRNHQQSNGHKLNRPLSREKKSSISEKRWNFKTIIDYLSLLLFSASTFYSFYVCSPNPLFTSSLYESQPSLCRALSTYRTHVLEPYVFPPIKQTLHYAHEISEPYVEEAQVRLSPYIKPVKTIIDTWAPYVNSCFRTTKYVWKDTILPLYTQTIRPYYETAIVPRYLRYIEPLLDPLQVKVQLFAYHVSNPVRSNANFVLHKLHQFYTLNVDPYVRIAGPYMCRSFDILRGLAANLWTRYTTYLRPLLLKAWNVGHSTIYPALRHSFRLLNNGIYTYVKWAAREVGAFRRQYIDRHVDRILEQVADPKVNGNVKEAPSLVVETKVASGTREPSDIYQETEIPDTFESESSSSLITATSISATPSPALSELVSSVSMSKVDTNNSSEIGTPAPTPLTPEVEGALSVAAKSADEVTKEFDTLDDSDFIPTPPPSNTPSPSADEIHPTMERGVIAEPTSFTESEQDLDEFLRELGVDQANPLPSTPDDTNEIFDDVVDSVRPKSEEERLAEVAAKRTEIVNRHEKWFEKLQASVKETGDALVETLQSLRDAAAEDVKSLGIRPSKANPNEVHEESVKDVRSLVWVDQDAEKLIKGLEGYLRKAEGRCNDWKIQTDSSDDETKNFKLDIASKEKERFSEIVSKVEGKFSERVDGVRLEVHKWYMSLKQQEAEEVVLASRVIKDLALRAQEDLSMDYAWLDDVTYLDWQRYHDLMRVHESFEIIVRQIANGTSTNPTPPSDPVVEALDELDRELQDLILGFNYALSGMRLQGLQIFNSRPLAHEGNEDHDGFFVVRDNEKRVVDLRGVDLGEVELKKEAVGLLPIKQDSDEAKESEERVGILPIPDAQVPENSESGFDASKIIIGKDKVQVEEALRDIPLKPPALRHAEF